MVKSTLPTRDEPDKANVKDKVGTVAAATATATTTRTTAATTSSTPKPKHKPTTDRQMEKVLALMMARTRGEVSSEDVESAVDELLTESFTKPPSTTKGITQKGESKVPPHAPPQQQQQKMSIQEDEDDYDDFDTTTKVPDKENPKMTAVSSPKKSTRTTINEQSSSSNNNSGDTRNNDTTVTWSGPKATIESMVQDDKAKENKNANKEGNGEDAMDKIPLGQSGARMMVTFGDGRNPNPKAVEAALLGARRCLQMAIKDARALRRRMKQEYARARATIKDGTRNLRTKDRMHLDYNREAVDPTMLYRAISGYDKLSYEPKCGFDVQQLQQLFPEEMNAYERWNQMHNAYKKSKDSSNNNTNNNNNAEMEHDTNNKDTSTDKKGSKKEGNGGDDDSNNDNEGSSDEEEEEVEVEENKVVEGGHLDERLANFDVRTEQMKDDWYLKFSQVRQGSFLPKGRGKRTAATIEWDKSRKHLTQKRGRPGNTWYNLSLPSVQFLYWLGFDQSSALPPPNEDTTEALAFLGYDFMGKIVERSIFLRTLRQMKQEEEDNQKAPNMNRMKQTKSKNILFELQDGEQLSVEDIERAVNDSTVRPTPLYSATDHSDQPAAAAQLYFGPGFEERIEMEMDELVPGKRQRMSKEEMEIRQEEDELFDSLKSPPKLDNALAMLTAESPVKDASQNEDKDKKQEGKIT